MSTLVFSKAMLLLLLVLAGGSSAAVGYYYQAKQNSLTSQVANLSTENNSQHNEINSQKDRIDNLTRQISNLTGQINLLTQEIAALRAQLGDSNLCSSGKTIVIGELLDLTSALSEIGTRAKDSSIWATTDINAMLTSGGCNLRFATTVNDYSLDNAKALTQLQAMAASGVKVVVGPSNSGTAQFLLSYANTNHIVLISPSSTSPALAIPNDYLFRTSPNDASEGLADARMIADRGATAVIIVQRHDTFGDGLANATAQRFKAISASNVVVATIQYATTTTDFTPILSALYSSFQSANTTYPNRVAIDAVSFEEIGQMLIQANAQHPTLLNGKLPWFGTDSNSLDPVIINSVAGPLFAKVRFTSTLYAAQNNTKSTAFYSRFAEVYPGVTCDVFCLGAYDDVWLAALATLQVGSYDGGKIQAVMLAVASNYYGLTGSLELQSSGDRVPISYQIWKVVSQAGSGSPTWTLGGTWAAATDTITWTSPP